MDDIPVHVEHLSDRFIDKLRLLIRARNLAYATEKKHVGWVLQFIRYHKRKHPKDFTVLAGKFEFDLGRYTY